MPNYGLTSHVLPVRAADLIDDDLDLLLSVSSFSWTIIKLGISVFHPLNFQFAVPNYA